MNERQAQMFLDVPCLRKFDRAVVLALEAFPGADLPGLMKLTGYPESTVGKALAMLLELEWATQAGTGFYVWVPELDMGDARTHLRRTGARIAEAQRKPVW